MEVVSNGKGSINYSDPSAKVKKKIGLISNCRKLYASGSMKSLTANVHNGTAVQNGSTVPPIKENESTIPPIRQKTAVLSRRHTYNGKIPVESRFVLNTRRSKNRRPRRSFSEEGSLSSRSSSTSSIFKPTTLSLTSDPDHKSEDGILDPVQIYQQGLNSLTHNERWQKEIALGNRVGFYRLYRDIGKGKFSKVKVAVHYLTKEKVAVKIVDKPKLPAKARRMLPNEVSTLQNLRHPHILRVFEIVETQTKLYLAMEYADGGDLFYRITTGGKFLEHEAKLIFAQIVSALLYLHKQSVVYKDLRADKVYFTAPNVVKLGDFTTGIRRFEDNLSMFGAVSPYAAPELLRKDGHLGPGVDVWSLGVLLFLSVTAALPFKGDTPITIKKQILHGRYTLPKHVSTECGILIGELLCQDPDKRMSINQIKNSDWLKATPLPQPINERSKLYATLEKETKLALSNLGIDEDIRKEHEGKGARSDVNGAFRILLHKHEKKFSYPYTNGHKNGTIRKVATCPTFQSKACAIL